MDGDHLRLLVLETEEEEETEDGVEIETKGVDREEGTVDRCLMAAFVFRSVSCVTM